MRCEFPPIYEQVARRPKDERRGTVCPIHYATGGMKADIELGLKKPGRAASHLRARADAYQVPRGVTVGKAAKANNAPI